MLGKLKGHDRRYHKIIFVVMIKKKCVFLKVFHNIILCLNYEIAIIFSESNS